jgi:ethanolamine utilization protein EutA
MRKTVTLVGLDFGTTTSSAAIASGKLMQNSVTRRMEIRDLEPQFCSAQVFTPFDGDVLDERRLADYLDGWLNEIPSAEVFGGGAMITGLAAQASNAGCVARQIRRRLKDAVIATAADPGLESWLTFMGNCWELSRANPERTFVNLDIGGGTTNIALGRNTEVSRTGSYFVGARHIQFEPGGYRLTTLSPYARQLLAYLDIHKHVGDRLSETDVQSIVDWYLQLLEAVVTGQSGARADELSALHQQMPFDSDHDVADLAITLSGGVGQLAYRGLQSGTWPETTAYGDLGIDLARRLVQRPFWRKQLDQWMPAGQGRATLFGLLRHNTQVSGGTVYLSDPARLPLGDLVILGTVSPNTPPDEVTRLVALARRTAQGACLKVELPQVDRTSAKTLAGQLRQSIAQHTTSGPIPLVLLVRENLGKVLGHLVTNWGRSPAPLVVIDEIDARDTQFASIGRKQQGVLPVSFHGMSAAT